MISPTAVLDLILSDLNMSCLFHSYYKSCISERVRVLSYIESYMTNPAPLFDLTSSDLEK